MLVVRRGVTREGAVDRAAADLAAQIREPGAACALVFSSSRHPPARLAAELADQLAPTPVYGCTTAGEIGPAGFEEGAVVGVTLRSPRLRVGAGWSTDISAFALSGGRQAVWAAAAQLDRAIGQLTPTRHVGVSLIDGRSGHEASFIAGAAATVPAVSFLGGSAADAGGDSRAHVFCGGRALTDCGLILLFETTHPMRAVMSEHMEPRSGRVVVTATDASGRIVHELNGWPAAAEYARLVGVPQQALDLPLLSRHPFGYYVGGRAYVRSVTRVEGESLRFASAVARGTVLTPMQSSNRMVETTEQALVEATGGMPGGVAMMLLFNCLGRHIEAASSGQVERLGGVLAGYPVVGFNTFGEQFNALHVNHTLTGLVLGHG